jgi:hypothetical protein
MRRIALAALALAGMLLAAPSAFAWTTLATGVENTVIPSMLVTSAGTELVSFESPIPGTISVARAGGAAHTVVTGDPIAGQTQLVQLPDGSIQLYFPNASGVARMTSTNDGVSWTGPIQTQSHDVGGVVGATVGPDGTPYFVQNGTGFVNVFKGLNGGTMRNVFADCCGYGSSIAVDSTGVVRVAFYSNADSAGQFVVEQLGSNLVPGQMYGISPTAPRDDRVPLVSDSAGFTYLGFPPGYPEASAFSVERFQGTATPKTERAMFFGGSFTGGDPHMALSIDPADRLWAAWTGQGRVHVTRSRTHAEHTGALVSSKLSGTAYDLSAVGLPGKVGAVDVIVNTGSSLVEQQLEPGLGVRAFHKVKKVHKKKVVIHYVQALDDLTPVGGATFKIAGHTYHANAKGIAKVEAGHGKAAAAGYVGASFRTR